LWSVREDCAANLEATLEGVAKMGYEGVELAGLHGRAGKEWARLLKNNGLAAPATHTGIDTLLPDKLQSTMDLYAEMDCKFLIVPALGGDYTKSADGFKRAAEAMNKAAETAAKAGFRVGYHNHDFEFRPVDGVLPFDVLAQTLGTSQVLELDLGWVCRAGKDPVALIAKYPGRSALVHVKAHSSKCETAVIGGDEVDWPRVLKACVEAGGTKWLVVEHEIYANPPMVCVEQCIAYLKTVAP
jgi:sugar phosphate isomerase/epimerase